MVYHIKSDNFSKDVQRVQMRIGVRTALLSALAGGTVAHICKLYLFPNMTSWYFEGVVALASLLLLLVYAHCLRRKLPESLESFYTLTDAGWLSETSDGSRAFVPWSRMKRAFLVRSGLVYTTASGLNYIYMLPGLSEAARQEMLAYVKQQIAAPQHAAPIPPPAYAITDSPLHFTPTRKKMLQAAAEVIRHVAPASVRFRWALFLVSILLSLVIGFVEIIWLWVGFVFLCLLAHDRVVHPGRNLLSRMKNEHPEQHITPHTWLTWHRSQDGAWICYDLRRNQPVLKSGDGFVSCALSAQSVVQVDADSPLPDWLPTPTQSAGVPARLRRVAHLLLAVAFILAGTGYWVRNLLEHYHPDAATLARQAFASPTPENLIALAELYGHYEKGSIRTARLLPPHGEEIFLQVELAEYDFSEVLMFRPDGTLITYCFYHPELAEAVVRIFTDPSEENLYALAKKMNIDREDIATIDYKRMSPHQFQFTLELKDSAIIIHTCYSNGCIF